MRGVILRTKEMEIWLKTKCLYCLLWWLLLLLLLLLLILPRLPLLLRHHELWPVDVAVLVLVVSLQDLVHEPDYLLQAHLLLDWLVLYGLVLSMFAMVVFLIIVMVVIIWNNKQYRLFSRAANDPLVLTITEKAHTRLLCNYHRLTVRGCPYIT